MMTAACVAVPALILVLEPLAPPVAPPPVEVSFQQARELRYAQRWYEAAQAYQTLVREHPTSGRLPDARYWLAACLEQDQRWEEAIEAYTTFLVRHPDQRLLGREARLNRIRCWGVRQWDNPTAVAGLVGSLTEEREDVRVAAALQLAKRRDPRAIPVLQAGLQSGASSEACRLALLAMGTQPQAPSAVAGRFLVIRIKERTRPEGVTIRLALGLARAVGGYLSDEQLRQAKGKGVDLDHLMDQALNAPKGTELFSLEDGKSRVSVTVE